jgi:hypothetical protein
VDLTQVADPSQPLGFDVVATGSGSIDTVGLNFAFTGAEGALMSPSNGVIITGPASDTSTDHYRGITVPPTSFGSGALVAASSGSGDNVGLSALFPGLNVPQGYVSGHALSDTSTYDNATFASLGATPGTYKWTWGTGAHADSFTLVIGAPAVPEPSTWALMALGFAGLGLAGWRSRRGSVAIAA